MTQASKKKMQREVEKELNRLRRRFDQTIHTNLTAYLDDRDPDSAVTNRDMCIGAMHKGFGVKVGVHLQEPEEPTEVEAQAKASGIEIVKA